MIEAVQLAMPTNIGQLQTTDAVLMTHVLHALIGEVNIAIMVQTEVTVLTL
jgi:hypothetical protein